MITVKRTVLTLTLLVSLIPTLIAQDFYAAQRKDWLLKAEQNKPKLQSAIKKPKQLVNIVKDQSAYQGWKSIPTVPIDSLYKVSFKKHKEVIVDFGEHMTGYFSFTLSPLNQIPDAPVRFKFIFGEVPGEIATSFDPYPGGLSRAWLQDEVITVMEIPSTVTVSRRLAFRYVKIELLATPSYDFAISDMQCRAVTSAINFPEALPNSTSQTIRDIDKVSQNTLKECMQIVYEDGPKRDQRLWIGDLYLQSMANNYSFQQYDITKSCLYLLAALSGENGMLNATVFDKPTYHASNQYLLEYAFLFNVTLKDYLLATGDKSTAEDLWIVAKKQLDIANKYLQNDGLMDFRRAEQEWWIFFDWKEGLYKEVALQGITIFTLENTYELAKMLNKENEVKYIPAMVKKMKQAARKNFYDKKTGLFFAERNKQISYASQIWMILSGVVTKDEAQRALKALDATENVVYPGTPYLYHYYIQSLIDCGMETEAKNALIDFWGGMIDKGADTFWEAYDPKDDYISPYNFFPINSYCHAWSCTPVYFIRKYPTIFQ
ncbi:glycoside hydrolase [Dysgonomonas sp. ZJ709]|uniref:alpha-L-rhamnosidase-related protein n=1 Tax=Dysgonomonas sp. ZJ709 TaxID=2709797 RepID=UPI0013ECF6A1|nr:glycoside hydrolase [Dysgonomonas sp. ZJ709]